MRGSERFGVLAAGLFAAASLAHSFLVVTGSADSPLVESMRQLERDFKTPRLEWQQ
jgi:hypothetical protein